MGGFRISIGRLPLGRRVCVVREERVCMLHQRLDISGSTDRPLYRRHVCFVPASAHGMASEDQSNASRFGTAFEMCVDRLRLTATELRQAAFAPRNELARTAGRPFSSSATPLSAEANGSANLLG